MRNRVGLLALVAAVLVIALVSVSHADTIFSTMTLTDCKCGLGTSKTALQGVPFSFSSGGTYELTDVAAWMHNVEFSATTLNFFIYSDNSGFPGTQLTALTGTVPAAPPNSYFDGVVTSHAPSPMLTLTSGTQYWLVLNLTPTLGWGAGGTLDLYPAYNDGSGWKLSDFPFSLQYAVYGVEIIPTEDVPEPTTFLLIGSGLAGLIGRRKWQCRQMAVTGSRERYPSAPC